MSFLIKDQKNLIQFVINGVFGIFGVSADVKKAFDSKLVDNRFFLKIRQKSLS